MSPDTPAPSRTPEQIAVDPMSAKLIARLREQAETLERAPVHDDMGLSLCHTQTCDLLRAAAEVLSRLALAERGEGWRPIETAPKDGTRVLGTGNRDGTPWKIVIRQLDRLDGWYSDPGKHHVQPTHWMPLPPSPA
jgi:hypothetical protein